VQPQTDSVNSEPMVDTDPLAQLLGEGAAGNVIGNPEDSIPEEIVALFQEHGLPKRKFRTILRAVPEGVAPSESSNNNLPYIAAWNKQIPSIDWVAKNYGPGDYQLTLLWSSKNPDEARLVNHVERVNFTISDKFTESYKRYQFDSKLKEMKDRNQKIRDAKLEKQLEVDIEGLTESDRTNTRKDGPINDPKEYLLALRKDAEAMGLVQKSGPNWDNILSLIVPSLPALLAAFSSMSANRQAQSDKLITLLLSQSNSANNQLVEIMKSVQGPTSGTEMIKELTQMIQQTVDFKEIMTGANQKESVVDKICKVVESIAPHFASVLAMPKEKRDGDYRAKIAQTYMANNEEMQVLREDPEVLRNCVTRWDAHYGWRQVDGLLDVAGLTRPPECPRRADLELPADARPQPGGSPATDNSREGLPSARDTAVPIDDEAQYTEDDSEALQEP